MRSNKRNREGLILLLVVGIDFLFGLVRCKEETIKVKADIYIVKVDSSGNVKGTNIISMSDFDYANSITQGRDGGYAVAVVYTREGDFDIRIMKLDSLGGIQWAETIGKRDDKARSIIQSSDGGYVVAGYTTTLTYFSSSSTDRVITDVDMYVVKLDSGGKVQWTKTIGKRYDDEEAYSIIQSSDGGYVVAGRTESFGAGGSDVYVVKLDSGGKVQWEKTIGGGSDDVAYSIIQSSDGCYVIAGWTRSFWSFGAGSSDVYVVKLDSEGKVQWEKTIGGGSDDVAYSIIQSSDGCYVIAGYTASFVREGNFYIEKTGSFGDTCWSQGITNYSASSGGSSGDSMSSPTLMTSVGGVFSGFIIFASMLIIYCWFGKKKKV
jgi:hypothetical protein